ncbi:hypothetical protein, conserved [Eimeria necatrix]|uniref:Uncharacterized protein n=1 Tax=Eimeria necatrix TaxID=51315 RepID=U6MTX1_9EIME|nr:hypothetical protein, conserved [Eimeria necatrix]CDJ67662.1 hypothetical protein, conserved [Eimeria necatrix]
MDERRRQRNLRDDTGSFGVPEPKQKQLHQLQQHQQQPQHQQNVEAAGQRVSSVLHSSNSTLSNASDSTSASLREKARKLQQEAMLSRDQATCVRGSQQTFRLRVAEMREQEAARLLELADTQDGGGAPGAATEGLSPAGSDLHPMRSSRGQLMSDTGSLPNVNSPRGAAQAGFPDEARVAELLAAAAERRDKATCVKGGKQRALLAMAEKLENEAHALAAAMKQQQNQQQQQHGTCDDPAYAPRDSARFGLPSGSSDASFSSQPPQNQQQQQYPPQQRQQEQRQHNYQQQQQPYQQPQPQHQYEQQQQPYHQQEHHRQYEQQQQHQYPQQQEQYPPHQQQQQQHQYQQQQQHQFAYQQERYPQQQGQPPHQQMPPDYRGYQSNSAMGSEASFGLGNEDRNRPLQQQRSLQQQPQQQVTMPDTPREHDDSTRGHTVLSNKKRALGPSQMSQADQALAEQAEKLRQEALLCRDKARCCSGAKQRQLLSLAELKEQRAADAIAQMTECSLYLHQNSSDSLQQSQKQQGYMQQHQIQQQSSRRAAGEHRGRVDPRGNSGIFDQ